jgi:hypothetical protein
MRRTLTTASIIALAGVGLLTGCPDRQIAEVNPSQGRVDYKDIPVTVNRDIDILFLIDNSDSMADKQQSLRDNFPNFINVLNTIQGGLPNVHLGVATSDMGSKGAKDASPAPTIGTLQNGGCGGVGDDGKLQLGTAGSADVMGRYISDVQDPTNPANRITNYTGQLADVFTKIASVGHLGCGFEQHLNGVRRALDPTNTTNAGFLRSRRRHPRRRR